MWNLIQTDLILLGQFVDIWGGLNLNGKTVKATVDGKPVSDYRNILLRDKEQINLVIKIGNKIIIFSKNLFGYSQSSF